MDEVYYSEFSADCTGKVLHIRQQTRGKGYSAVGSLQSFSDLHLDLETGEVYRPGDLFADEAGARQIIYEKIVEENGGYLSERLDGFVEGHRLDFGVTGDSLYYDVWYYLNSAVPLEIPLEEFGDCLDRDGRFYRALTASWD